MKKYIGMVFALVCMLSLTACGNEKEAMKLLLPKVENITEIELLENTSEVPSKITDTEEIAKLISGIKEHSKATKKESVNDQPTNIDYYIIMKLIIRMQRGNKVKDTYISIKKRK